VPLTRSLNFFRLESRDSGVVSGPIGNRRLGALDDGPAPVDRMLEFLDRSLPVEVEDLKLGCRERGPGSTLGDIKVGILARPTTSAEGEVGNFGDVGSDAAGSRVKESIFLRPSLSLLGGRLFDSRVFGAEVPGCASVSSWGFSISRPRTRPLALLRRSLTLFFETSVRGTRLRSSASHTDENAP